VCIDLLSAKQDAVDRGTDFEFPGGVVCERCAELFATLDLAHGTCREIARGEMPADVRRDLLARIQAAA